MKLKTLVLPGLALFIGIAATLVSLALPYQYTARGLIVISRKADSSSGSFFTYEGSYSQQTASAYTPTFVAILQSPDTLESTGIFSDIKKASRLVKVRKEGQQTVTLSVKGNSANQANEYWNKILDTATKTAEKNSGDPLIAINSTEGSPVVLKSYPDWSAIFVGSALISFITLVSLRVIAGYLKEGNDH